MRWLSDMRPKPTVTQNCDHHTWAAVWLGLPLRHHLPGCSLGTEEHALRTAPSGCT